MAFSDEDKVLFKCLQESKKNMVLLIGKHFKQRLAPYFYCIAELDQNFVFIRKCRFCHNTLMTL